MTTQLLASELTNLVQESKRKHNDLRQAAERSLEELKGIRGGNESQVAAELAQRVNFVNPFIIACGSKNAKFTGIAIVCLLRLIMSSALPRSKLSPVLEALREATSSGLDVQLKILQALPTLLQNYATEVKGDLLVTALNVCFILQSSKNGIVNNTSAATLQQLVVSVFDKVVVEDRSTAESTNYVGEAPTQDGSVQLPSAAMDAYRIFNDICLMTENQRPEYLRFTGLPQTFGLELIESVLTNHAAIFSTHPEQAHVLRVRVMPFLISALSNKINFATSVRLGGEALEILTQLLDQDMALWRRALCMEVFRGIFGEPGLLRRIYLLYDDTEGQKNALKDLTAAFVRISTERPAVIGLTHQSTIPVANPYGSLGSSTDQAMLEASGVAGIISGSVSDGSNTGISSQFSTMRVPCIDQLDKTDPPSIPESYVFALTLSCITSLSEGLAKFILPLTVPGEGRSRRRPKTSDAEKSSPATIAEEEGEPSKTNLDRVVSSNSLERSGSFKRNPVPVNPLVLKDHPLHQEVQICAKMVDECWPAILATCSTFLYAALDSEYYHGLVRAFQKFAHVAGLLQLATPRDAFLTTLGKAAVPPNVFTACLGAGSSKPMVSTPATEAPNGILGNARGLLSVENLVTPVGAAGERQRQASIDANAVPQTLNTRNLLCLRALLNLGIALGPTLGSSWRIVLETMQQADFILFSTGEIAGRTPIATKSQDARAENEANSLLANFGTEVKQVKTAGTRLLESTVDFPNEPFLEVVNAICNLLERQPDDASEPSSRPNSPPFPDPVASGAGRLANPNWPASAHAQHLHAVCGRPELSGWTRFTSELANMLSAAPASPQVRRRAADILVDLVLNAAKAAANLSDELRSQVQQRLLEALRDSLLPLQKEERASSITNYATDVDIHKVILEGLKSLLDDSGETLISGWDVAFEIIGSIFIKKRFADDTSRGADSQSTVVLTRSSKLIRSSFSSLQLISSDFLSSLPNSCFLILVDTLYKFCSQDDDLNIALTTVTFFWVLSDFLSGKNKSLPITDSLIGDADDDSLAAKAADSQDPSSDAALWMLLLLRLTNVTADDRLELRNSATHTLLRIFDAYGDRLSPEGWAICIKSVIFRLLSSVETELGSVSEQEVEEKERAEWHDTAVVVINGISGLLANYLDVLTVHPTFNSYWQQLLGHFASLLDFQVLEINTATFKALTQILSQSQNGAKQNFNKTTIDLAWDLWARGIPVSKQTDKAEVLDNQNCLLAYVAALRDVYRLIQSDLGLERVSRMLRLLREAMQQASPGSFVADIEYLTPLQGQILDVLKMLRTDIAGVPSALIQQTAEFVSLAFDDDIGPQPRRTQKRTYVAMSKASMLMLESFMVGHAADLDMYSSGAFLAALTSLSKPIVLKYQFTTVTKSVQPWKQATTSTLTILGAAMPQLRNLGVPRPALQDIWRRIVAIANGITSADCDVPPERINVAEDEDFDISSFHKLRELTIPWMGAEVVPDMTRKRFAESLFRISIIHAPAPAESKIIYGNNLEGHGLATVYKARSGRTVDASPSYRHRMAYVCLDELFSLVMSHDEASTPQIMVQPPTPAFFPPPGQPSSSQDGGGGMMEAPHSLHVRLARTAAPYLILRAALTLRAYIADQPLRGADAAAAVAAQGAEADFGAAGGAQERERGHTGLCERGERVAEALVEAVPAHRGRGPGGGL
ncbi:Protein MON2-like protein [Apiospora aurea]|uniref:Protein MON2-like protein n=1 Tax=Apiospora aurea TaxID=335848 RepID=A0ABR1PXD6_9PEZI